MKTIRLKKIKHYWHLYLLVLPGLCFLITFSYFPAWSAIYHSFFNWDGGDVKIFTGLGNYIRAFTDPMLGYAFIVVFILIFSNLFKMIPSIMTAVVIHRLRSRKWAYAYRVLFVIPMIIPGIVWLLIWKYFFDPTFGILNKMLRMTGIMSLLQGLDQVFGWQVFMKGVDPAWLSQKELVIPALIIWGFPWVGVVGVLIYLAGLSNIGKDVYDACEIDGVGWFRKFTAIELPLILGQIRINLVLMIINTMRGYGLVLILLGDTGGPGGAGMVPGLYMFRKAFVDQEAGYACAVGLLIFFVILLLTVLNNKLVKSQR